MIWEFLILLSFPDLMKIFLVIFIIRFITGFPDLMISLVIFIIRFIIPQLSGVRDILFVRLFKEQLAFLRENSNLNLFFRL